MLVIKATHMCLLNLLLLDTVFVTIMNKMFTMIDSDQIWSLNLNVWNEKHD